MIKIMYRTLIGMFVIIVFSSSFADTLRITNEKYDVGIFSIHINGHKQSITVKKGEHRDININRVVTDFKVNVSSLDVKNMEGEKYDEVAVICDTNNNLKDFNTFNKYLDFNWNIVILEDGEILFEKFVMGGGLAKIRPNPNYEYK